MNEDVVEKPIQGCFFRQSSLETRLSPVHLSEDSGSSDEEVKNICHPPKIVDFVLKPQENLNDKSAKKQEAEEGTKERFSAAKNAVSADLEALYSKVNKSGNAVPNLEKSSDRKSVSSSKNAISADLKPLYDKPKSTKLSEDLIKEIKETSDKSAEIKKPQDVNQESRVGLIKDIQTSKTSKMASPRPKSPRPVVSKSDKEESFWDKIGTLGRKKRIKEVQEVEAEGKYAIDSPGNPNAPIVPPEEYALEENEERCMIQPHAFNDPKLHELIQVLIEWINDELASQRIIVQDLSEDLYDGQVLQKLLEKLTGDKLDVPEVTQSEEGQRQKLAVVLAHFNKKPPRGVARSAQRYYWILFIITIYLIKYCVFGDGNFHSIATMTSENFTCERGEKFILDCNDCFCDDKTKTYILCAKNYCRKRPPCTPFMTFQYKCKYCTCLPKGIKFCVVTNCVKSRAVLGVHGIASNKWSVEAIHSKNLVSILHLLVALARHFRAPVRLPEHVSIAVVVVQKSSGQLIHRTVRENLTSAYDDVGMRCERDAFDTLFDHAPDKLQVVKKSLVTFVNKHLNKINLEVTELESQFHDGVYLTLLMGLLEGFFVPLHSFHLTPKEFEQKVHNVAFAFELMEEVGIARPKARPEDIVNQDLKSTLRVLYNLFSRYKNVG